MADVFETPTELGNLFNKKKGKTYSGGGMRNPNIDTLGEKYARITDCSIFYKADKNAHHLVTTYEILGKEEGFDDDPDEGKKMKSWDSINFGDPSKDHEKQVERLTDRIEKLGGNTGDVEFGDLPNVCSEIKEAAPLVSLKITAGRGWPGAANDYWVNLVGRLE